MVFFIFSVDFFCFVMAICRGRLLVMDLQFVVGFLNLARIRVGLSRKVSCLWPSLCERSTIVVGFLRFVLVALAL